MASNNIWILENTDTSSEYIPTHKDLQPSYNTPNFYPAEEWIHIPEYDYDACANYAPPHHIHVYIHSYQVEIDAKWVVSCGDTTENDSKVSTYPFMDRML
jgi:hypothetical protein